MRKAMILIASLFAGVALAAEESAAVHHGNHQRYMEGQSLDALAAVRRAAGDEKGAADAEVLAANAYRDCGVFVS